MQKKIASEELQVYTFDQEKAEKSLTKESGDEEEEEIAFWKRRIAPFAVSLIAVVGTFTHLFGVLPYSDADRFGPYKVTEALLPFRVVFGIMLLNIPFAIYIYSSRTELGPNLIRCFRTINFILAAGIVISGFLLLDDIEIMNNVYKFKNEKNERVQESLTFTLAVYSKCCFDPVDSIAPALDCGSKNGTEPCFDDQDFFEELDETLDFDSKLCRTEISLRNEQTRVTARQKLNEEELCGLGEEGYVVFLAKSVESVLLTRFVQALLFGIFLIPITSLLCLN